MQTLSLKMHYIIESNKHLLLKFAYLVILSVFLIISKSNRTTLLRAITVAHRSIACELKFHPSKSCLTQHSERLMGLRTYCTTPFVGLAISKITKSWTYQW